MLYREHREPGPGPNINILMMHRMDRLVEPAAMQQQMAEIKMNRMNEWCYQNYQRKPTPK